ncbi:MAG: hypothetical protein IKL51_09635 [Lachnospiraceae bacterium]|nr:hypothetical protein [Lachnospiraceae bacterium]
MADWNDIKKAFEREFNKAETEFISNEQTLLHSIANYLGKIKGTTSVQGYNTDDMLEFLQKPVPEIKEILGGKWAELDDTALEPLIYSLAKKVKKSVSFLG